MVDTNAAPAVTGYDAGDIALIIAARGLRSFGYGLLAVLLGMALSRAGLAPAAIGAIITVSLVGDSRSSSSRPHSSRRVAASGS